MVIKKKKKRAESHWGGVGGGETGRKYYIRNVKKPPLRNFGETESIPNIGKEIEKRSGAKGFTEKKKINEMKLSRLESDQRHLQKGLAQTPSSAWRGSLCDPLQKAAGEVAAQSQLQD